MQIGAMAPRSLASRSFLSRRRLLAGVGAALLAAPAQAASPLVFDHAYGHTVLKAPAQRVVSLGYTAHDTLLALDVVPLALRYWYGPYDSGVWPWAEPYLRGARPEVLRGEVSAERVAALEPDLIVATGSGISAEEYEVLRRIAPTLVHQAQDGPYGTPWDKLTLTLGRATGREAMAEARIAEMWDTFAAAARRLGTAGKHAAPAYHWAGTTGVFLPGDSRATFVEEMGFALPQKVLDLPRGNFFLELSPEDLSPLDADLLIWVSSFDRDSDLSALPMRRTLTAHRQGREVYAGALVGGAMAHGSVLSLPFALKALEADIAAALDGDPATVVASAEAAGLVGP